MKEKIFVLRNPIHIVRTVAWCFEEKMISTSEGLVELRSFYSKEETDSTTAMVDFLIIHGAFYNAELISDLQKELVKVLESKHIPTIRVHSLSLINHGKSQRRKCVNLIPFQADLNVLDEVLAFLGRKTILIGHSKGGMLIQKYLEKQPTLASILIAPMNRSWKFRIWINKYFLKFQKKASLRAFFSLSPKKAMNAHVIQDIFFCEKISSSYFEGIANLCAKFEEESLRNLISTLTGNMDYNKIAKTPTLLIGGVEDKTVRKDQLEWLQKKLQAKLVLIENAGHCDLVNDNIIGVPRDQGKVKNVVEAILSFATNLLEVG